MLHIVIAAVAKAKAGPERDLYDAYVARLPWRVDLKEIEIKKDLAVDVRKAREGEALLAAVPQGAKLVALDERGRTETSEAFAARLGRWRDDGVRTVAFIIGGADGLDEAVRKKADLVLSFGALTWPHMLVRAMLAEQVYRAQSILAGHPYHRS
ncbi:MAG: 23S rRNA (pseudouridine(1915)-N(3))-methyltransferase RlmH [Proteobacteria bacterium]|nr:23S rRNA (pseudouridine(1915)-N(3))-methyltransferase RlmH [Pseudomonadota bacterium]